MSELTEQRFFSETVEYLRRQSHQAKKTVWVEALNKNVTACVYLAADGNKCAVGYWMPEHPAVAAEMAVAGLACDYPELEGVAWPATPRGVELADDLQQLHDDESYRRLDGGGLSEDGEQFAEYIANKFGLVYTAPNVSAAR